MRRFRVLLAASVTLASCGVLAIAAVAAKDDPGGRQGPRIVQAPALAGAQPISSRDRVYTADQSSNTVSVIDPSTNRVLGTRSLGEDRLQGVLGPTDTTEVNVHGLGFSRDGRTLDVISVTSNGAQVLDTRTNRVRRAYQTGRSPHEGFLAPDGKSLWVAVRGEQSVEILDLRRGVVDRIRTGLGPSKVVFSPDGRRAYVNHLRDGHVSVIDVRRRRVIARISGLADGSSSDEAISPDGRELWLGHPASGEMSVIDLRTGRVTAKLATGPRTNHPTFVTTRAGAFAYVTVGGMNQTLVYRRGSPPRLVGRIADGGEAPHGIWPSPDNTRVYVALQKSDAVDVIDTSTRKVIRTLRTGQDPQALVYVAGAVPSGTGRQGLGRQGLDRRVQTRPVQVRGVPGTAKATVREVDTLDEIDVTAKDLPPGRQFTVFAIRGGRSTALLDVKSDARGGVEEALAFAKLFADEPDALVLVAQGTRP